MALGHVLYAGLSRINFVLGLGLIWPDYDRDKFNIVLCLVQSRQNYELFILRLVHTGLRWCLFFLLNAE